MSKVKIIKIILLLFLSLFLLGLVSSYFININYYFLKSNLKDDGYGGFALERGSNEYIVDGCGQGTMLDSTLGLCWMKNMSKAGQLAWAVDTSYPTPYFNETTKSYDWPSGRVDTDYPAFKYCNDLVLGNRDDWRVPTRNELFTLVDEIGPSGSTCLTLESFGFTDCSDSAIYWASIVTSRYTNYPWVVEINVGGDNGNYKTSATDVICVTSVN